MSEGSPLLEADVKRIEVEKENAIKS
jgi:hypothetical protein